MKQQIGIGLLGIGVIGSQVARVLTDRAPALSAQAGAQVRLSRIKVLPPDLDRPVTKTFSAELFTTSDDTFFNDESIDIIIELIGGEKPAYEYIKKSLQNGKHVVTANKEVIAKHGTELRSLARDNGVSLYYEASVGGGIPIIAPLERDLKANSIRSIYAIINGTTNYILTRMSHEGIEFSRALKQAQELGYAEANPNNDIEGIDASYKLAIMATLAFESQIKPEQVFHEGISRLDARDFKYANELGYTIKLLAIAKQYDNNGEARVHPALIRKEAALASVNGVFNAISIEGDLVGRIVFSGQGAGPLPTSSAVVADVLRASSDILTGSRSCALKVDASKVVKPISQITTRYYIRMNILDNPGVLANIARILGQHGISISSVIQKETDSLSQTAEIVIMTHPAASCSIEAATGQLGGLDVVREINNVIRVEDQ
jgi:homoserine dehydrogenase